MTLDPGRGTKLRRACTLVLTTCEHITVREVVVRRIGHFCKVQRQVLTADQAR
jgi:hypothetical protein